MKKEFLSLLDRRVKFLSSSEDLESADKVILGLPMDITTSFRSGTRLAPFRVREVSEGIEEYSIYQDKSLEDITFYDAGDVILPFGNVNESLKRIELIVREFLGKQKKVFAIGGEHLVSLAMVKAYHAYYDDLVVIQMDAHADLREDYMGEPNSHATVMRRVADEIGPKNIFQMGIRSATKDEVLYGQSNTNLYIDKLSEIVDEVIDLVKDRPVFITLDIDVLDPAYAPGTGTPEAGGCSSKELFQTLKKLSGLNVVGFDMVEISPPNENGNNTSILGAKIMREALLYY